MKNGPILTILFFLDIWNRPCWFQIWTQNCKIPTRNASNQQFSNWHSKNKMATAPNPNTPRVATNFQVKSNKYNYFLHKTTSSLNAGHNADHFDINFTSVCCLEAEISWILYLWALWPLCRWPKVVLSRKARQCIHMHCCCQGLLFIFLAKFTVLIAKFQHYSRYFD